MSPDDLRGKIDQVIRMLESRSENIFQEKYSEMELDTLEQNVKKCYEIMNRRLLPRDNRVHA